MNFEVGQIVDGEIVSIKPYGIFIKLDKGLAFCHISELSHDYIKNISDKFKLKDKVKGKIIQIDTETNKITVSIKQLLQNNIKTHEKKLDEKIIKKEKSIPSFDAMLNNYLKSSEDKIKDINARDKKRYKH